VYYFILINWFSMYLYFSNKFSI